MPTASISSHVSIECLHNSRASGPVLERGKIGVESLLKRSCCGARGRFVAMNSEVLRQFDKGLSPEIEAGWKSIFRCGFHFSTVAPYYLLVFNASLICWRGYLHG